MHLLRDRERGWLHLLALAYALSAYALGLVLMITQPLPLALLGSLPLAHGLVIGAYLIHECTHNIIFADHLHNRLLGSALSWLVGGGYGDYRDIRRKHMRHHVDRADVIAYDYRELMQRHPALCRAVETLEWACIPAVDLLMHGLVLALPFSLPTRRYRRGRVVRQLLIRGGLFATLAAINPAILLAYPLGYLIFLHAIRFMDVHQHTYPVVLDLDSREPKQGKVADRSFEQRNTYSNLCPGHPWVNLMTLNFGYHNAHHLKPSLPWYDLPKLHREAFPDHDSHLLPLRSLVASYHRYRVRRVLNGDDPDLPVGDGREFVGVLGVSFVTAH